MGKRNHIGILIIFNYNLLVYQFCKNNIFLTRFTNAKAVKVVNYKSDGIVTKFKMADLV